MQQFLKELAVLLDNVEAGQVDAHLQPGTVRQVDSAAYERVVLNQIAFDVEIIIAFEPFSLNIVGCECGGSPQVRAKGALSVGCNKGRSYPRRQLFGMEQISLDVMSDTVVGKKVAISS